MTLARRFYQKVVVAVNGCHSWMGAMDQAGYGNFYLGRGPDGRKQYTKAPRVAWMLSHGEPVPDGLCVCHHCDNPACVNPEHLFLGTRAENLADMTRKGRRSRVGAPGESNGRAKLSASQVAQIRRRVAAGEPKRALAREYGVRHGTIQFAVRGATWSSGRVAA